MSWDVLFYSALAGGGVGAVSGLFGVGGGFLLVPVLNILLGIPMQVAVGCGVCQVLGPATTSMLARDIRREHLRLPLIISGGLMVGVIAGAVLLQRAKDSGFLETGGVQIPLADVAVLGTYLLLLSGLAAFAFWEAYRLKCNRPLPRGWLVKLTIPPFVELAEIDGPPVSLPVLCWFGLVVGFTSGLLGISGGLLLLPGFVFLLGIRTHKAILASLVIVWGVSVGSTAVHAWLGNVDLQLVVALLFGGTVGARIGADFGQQLEGPQVRYAFAWLMLAAAALIAARFAWLFL